MWRREESMKLRAGGWGKERKKQQENRFIWETENECAPAKIKWHSREAEQVREISIETAFVFFIISFFFFFLNIFGNFFCISFVLFIRSEMINVWHAWISTVNSYLITSQLTVQIGRKQIGKHKKWKGMKGKKNQRS